MTETRLRQSVVNACRRMNALNINHGSSGNVSARYAGGMLISPSGIPYEQMRARDVVHVRADGSYAGDVRPSSEWRFHLDLLHHHREAGAVVHAHPDNCTALAIRHMEIPPLHYMIAAAGGDNIRCADYATFGSAELSANVLTAMQGRRACLMANHGMVAVGADLERALWLAVEVEALARQYVLTLQLGGPCLLSSEEISRVLEKFADYGYREPGSEQD